MRGNACYKDSFILFALFAVTGQFLKFIHLCSFSDVPTFGPQAASAAQLNGPLIAVGGRNAPHSRSLKKLASADSRILIGHEAGW